MDTTKTVDFLDFLIEMGRPNLAKADLQRKLGRSGNSTLRPVVMW